MPDEAQSIASDLNEGTHGDPIPTDVKARLQEKFLSFQDDRRKIHERMESYVLDYLSHDGNLTRRYELLDEEYAKDAPNLNHLVLRDDKKAENALWSMRDIAIVLGRNVSNVLRTLRNMQALPEWNRALAAVTHRMETGGRDASVLYDVQIFDLVVDYFEYVYLERFTKPRHGPAMSSAYRDAVFAFWEHLHSAEKDSGRMAALEGESAPMADAFTPRTVADRIFQSIRLIARRVFSVKIGSFLLLLFAVFYELSKRYSFLNIAVPLMSLLGLCFSLYKMSSKHKSYTPWLADIGACSVTLCLLWTLAMIISPDSPTMRLLSSDRLTTSHNTPAEAGANLSPQDENPHHVEIHAAGIGSGVRDGEFYRVNIKVPAAHLREIFYKTELDQNFMTTGGSTYQSSAGTGYFYPNTEARLPIDSREVYVKYIDDDGVEHGPYKIEMTFERAMIQEALSHLNLFGSTAWVSVRENEAGNGGVDIVTAVPSILKMILDERNVVSRITYGINKANPDTEYIVNPDSTRPWQPSLIKKNVTEEIRYLSAQVHFTDGSKSEIRIYDQN